MDVLEEQEINSRKAAKVAIAATITIGIIDQNIVGTVRKSSNTVSLLANV